MPLISAPTLAALGDLPRICDTRWYLSEPDLGWRQYREAHIPGAVFVDLETVLSGDHGPGRHPLPSPEAFCANLGRLGIAPDTHVVVYDSANGAVAARLWWMLRSVGHPRVSVLEGGIDRWVAAGLPLTAEASVVVPEFYPRITEWADVVDRYEVAKAIGTRSLVDARANQRYRGEIEPIDSRPGHIPSAINLPYADNLNADGTFKTREVLAERFADLGDQPIVYCGSGISACHNLLAMELGGINGGKLYAGSWSDWSSHDDLPAETE